MDIYFNMRPTTTGDYNEDFQMVYEGVSWFGDKVACNGGMRTWTRLSRKNPNVDVGDTGPVNPGETVRFYLRGSDSWSNGSAYSWDFNNDTTQGWYALNQCSVARDGSNGLKFVCSGTDPHCGSSGGLALNASVNTWMAIRMWTNAGSYARFFWANEYGGFSVDRTISWDITPDSQWHTYYVQLTDGIGWRGTVNQVRLDPYDDGTTSSATVYVDYIRIYGQGQDGTYLNGVALGQTGALAGDSDTSASFDGTDDYIHVAPGFSNFTNGLTIELWAKPTAANNYARFIDFGNGPGGSSDQNIIFYRIGTTNDLAFYVNNNGTADYLIVSGAITNNAWHHYAVTMTSGKQ